MRGSLTSQSTEDACDYASPGIAFRHYGRRRHSDFLTYRGSIPRLHVLLSTLRFQPCDCGRRLFLSRKLCPILCSHFKGSLQPLIVLSKLDAAG